MNISTDRSLTILAAQGDQEAFGKLVRRHQSAIFSVAYRMLGNYRDAEDATQETFIRAYYAFDTFDTTRPLLPWLKRIEINVCLNRIKRDRPISSLDDYLPSLKEGSPAPEVQTTIRERNAEIYTAVLSLPPHFRAVIELRHFQDLSYAEISEVLDRPLSSIKSDLFRARKMLAEKLKDLKN
jgi:RNA polymerase sigma-70 factor (ECF subfamily)